MENYYEVLGISQDAAPKDVKSAFRRQAKKHHPDIADNAGVGSVAVGNVGTSAGDGTGNGDDRRREPEPVPRQSGNIRSVRESAMRLILEAYRILSDAEKRRAYDRLLRKRALEDGGFDYRRFLKERSQDPESQAKLIVYDLLHDLDGEAIEVFERAKSLGDFRLERWMERGEAMDAEYCIAEEYEKRGRYLKAYTIYKRLIVMEHEKAWFRYYYDVLAMRFRAVVLQKLPGLIDEDDYLDRLDEAIELDVGDRDSAQFHRKKAEIFVRRRDLDAAKAELDASARLVPRLPGLAALRRRTASLE
ncbi:MAG: DnaJ domain-containing protein [Rectinema sp.]